MASKWNIGNRVDAAEVARELGIARQSFTRHCRAGRVPGAYQSPGGHWRVRWSAELAAMVAAATGRPLRRRRGVAFAKSADPARETGVALAALAEKSADLLERRLQSIRAEYRQRIRTLRTVADAVRTIPEPLKLAGDLFRLVVEPTHGL